MMRDDFTDELISAYLDGELSADEKVRAEQLLETSPECRQLYDELRALRQDMQSLPRHQLADDFADRVLHEAERQLLSSPSDPGSPAATTVAAQRGPQSLRKTAGGRRPWRRTVWMVGTVAAAWLLIVMVVLRGKQDAVVELDSPPAAVGEQEQAEAGQEPDGEAVDDGRPEAVPRPTDRPAVADRPEPSRPDRADGPAAVARTEARPEPLPQDSPRQGTTEPARPQPEELVQPEAGPAQPDQKVVGPGLPDSFMPQYVFVVEVTLTRQGSQNQAFDKSLTSHGVVYEMSVQAGKPLEEALLASRILRSGDEPQEPQDEREPPHQAQLVYVVATGKQVDLTVGDLLARQQEIASVRFNLATKPAELAVFDQLRQAVGIGPAGEQAEELSPVERRAAQRQQLTRHVGRARRLMVETSLLSSSARNAAAPVDPAAMPRPAPKPQPAKPVKQPADDPTAPGTETIYEVLFVVQQPPNDK